MQEVTRDIPLRSEGELRLHAAIRAVLSPGIWFVLAAQIVLVFSMQWRVPADAAPLASALVIFLTATALLLFFYLQAGAFHALTLGREALSVGEIIRAGNTVFASFVWLTLKAGLLFALVINILVLMALLLTGSDLKSLTQALSAFFGPATGALAFVFVYWLPFVFVQREFRLLPSLKASLQIAWTRISHSAFLALLVLAPALATGFIPAESPVLIDALASVVTGFMGWIAYIYCTDILRQNRDVARDEASA
ncbi:MAG: hypothetical protein A3E57_02285 [Candidatus Muproteobacteria bacterium RIFCSPHIGHO2_12_FULL_60_33]|uniref:Uncharacterized protein n=1 Tax=Candidatus Muproteobacteria bacterium RIFCSPLOWO2_01_FULL_60_18 TaxID=1817768 RepID=A0A1F6U5H8_9PROT|nr:MAG: hypothetical protein A2W42_04605 [Candidatus Muproteobacteria bacterium RIFCSPHIGHO2_01_60_12]OGI52621.1 MAG: hypothetical protein A3A87_09210 [Candidatus Muproteobacteria bacterium RIFCSPLOWO2_01_FULL_60_18]OGI55256.1 MAG: hypothetical protein A3D32_02450 [Candidatus Muproteobacteria bacterium RIFCSPHIGHO2_02_FULL_60_13]OGI56417.1 MAG: hypothetical protein A3E57_02285 [Candidatus Muproteobacteria bacterium RIFCSPHIGHO2_12_FULL_60_33]